MMRSILLIVSVLLLTCTEEERSTRVDKAIEAPAIVLSHSDVFYDTKLSLWKLRSDSSLASGRITRFFQGGGVAKETPVFRGRKEGTQLTYFHDGRLRFLETYSKNKLNGKVKRWGIKEGYQLLAELNYKDGKLNGEQKKWFASGELHKHLNMKEGKEDGMQKAYRKNGALYANYEAFEGRTFGLKRSDLCFELNDEKVVFKN